MKGCQGAETCAHAQAVRAFEMRVMHSGIQISEAAGQTRKQWMLEQRWLPSFVHFDYCHRCSRRFLNVLDFAPAHRNCACSTRPRSCSRGNLPRPSSSRPLQKHRPVRSTFRMQSRERKPRHRHMSPYPSLRKALKSPSCPLLPRPQYNPSTCNTDRRRFRPKTIFPAALMAYNPCWRSSPPPSHPLFCTKPPRRAPTLSGASLPPCSSHTSLNPKSS